MIPPCIDVVSSNTTSIVAFTNTFACDKWAVPHIVAPFVVAIMTRNPWFGFVMAGIAEMLEYLVYAIAGNFVVFVFTGTDGITENDRTENVAGILLEDWLIQGGIGALILGSVFLWIIKGKTYLTLNDLTRCKNIGKFIFYIIMTLLLMIPAFIYPFSIDSFQAGILLYPIIQLLLIGIIYIYNSLFAKEEFQTEFWFTFWFFSLVINFSNLWDYL